jgi:hypothetical protein
VRFAARAPPGKNAFLPGGRSPARKLANPLETRPFRAGTPGGSSLPLGDLSKDPELDALLAQLGYYRVELNALTGPSFLGWLEAKLAEEGVAKVIPGEETLREAYERAAVRARVNRRVREIVEEEFDEAPEVEVPDGLQGRVREALDEEPGRTWDGVITALVEEDGDEDGDE